MFGYGKKQQQIKKTSSETTLLYYKIDKEGVITNYQAWLRGWREHKITEFDVFFQEGLRELKQKEYDLEEELKGLEYQPLVTISKEFWVPSTGKILEIIATGNETTRKNMITKLMGQVMADMTAESRHMVMEWTRLDAKDPADPESALKADTIKEAYEKFDWLFIFEAAMVTHLHADCTVDETTILECQEKAINKLKSLKHEQGSIQVWLQKFDDAIEECETMGATVTDKMKRIY